MSVVEQEQRGTDWCLLTGLSIHKTENKFVDNGLEDPEK